MDPMSRRDFFVWPTTAALVLMSREPVFAARKTVAAEPPEPVDVTIPPASRQFIAEYMRVMNAPGLTLALAGRDGGLATGTFGFVDPEHQLSVNDQHRFEIGSITKSFAAIVILQLQDEGKLDVQHPISRYLPWLPVDASYGEIRIHHLLTHSAGLPSDSPLIPTESGMRLRQTYKPGTRFHYCNWGYAALGRLIESIDRVSWATAVTRRVLLPLGMKDTVGEISSESRARLAPSYVPLFDDRPYPRQGALAPAGNGTFTLASGSIASTPGDMARYLQMLLNRGVGPTGRIMSTEGFKLLSTAHIAAEEFGPGASYGYGIAIDRLDGHVRLRHTGGMLSFMSSLQVDMDAGFGAFASVNAQLDYRPNPITQYSLQLMRAAAEHKAPPPEPPADEDAELKNAAAYTGTFRALDGRVLEIIAENGGLVLVAEGARITLQHQREDQFIALSPKFALFSIVFGRDTTAPKGAKAGALAPVVELGYGPDWYAHSRYAGGVPPAADAALGNYTGLYVSNDPWVGTKRVVLRRGQLWMDGVIPLIPVGDRLFQFGDEQESPEMAEFRSVIDAKAEVLVIAAGALQRI